MNAKTRKSILDVYKMKSQQRLLYLIPIRDDSEVVVGYLRPVIADFETAMPDCVALFSSWRAENPSLSPARFPITCDRTRNWLQKLVIDNDNRIVFMVQSVNGVYVGHIGLAAFDDAHSAAEIDSVLKGTKTGYPRMMEYALRALVDWGKRALGLCHITLEVLWDNQHAIEYYKRCGFSEETLIPLEKEMFDDEIKWHPCADLKRRDAEKYYLCMRLC